jgi:hypothetical protein
MKNRRKYLREIQQSIRGSRGADTCASRGADLRESIPVQTYGTTPQ